jgi:hypothetical protein
MEFLERYRLVSRRPALRLEARRARLAVAGAAGGGIVLLVAGAGVSGRGELLAVAAVGAAAGVGALLHRERWTIDGQGVRLDRAPWLRPVIRPREAFERVTLRCVVANGPPVLLPWQVVLEDGNGGGVFVLAFEGELSARIVGLLVVEALDLVLVEPGEVAPEVARAVRAALDRI